MKTITSYTSAEKVALIEENGYEVMANKVTVRSGRSVSSSDVDFAYKKGIKYTIDEAFLNVVLLLLDDPSSGGGAYTGGDGIDVVLAVISVDATVSRAGHTRTFASLTGKPTTIAGCGITDAYTKTEVDALTWDWSDLTSGVPTTIAGYGITDAYTKVETEALNWNWADITAGVPTTFGGYGISDTFAHLNTALSDATLYKWEADQGAVNLHGNNVVYGVAASTACVGNDARVNNGQTAFGWGDWFTGVDQAFVNGLNVTAATLSGFDPADYLLNTTDTLTGDLTVSGLAGNDRLVTVDAAGKLISEANLTFDGTDLTTAGLLLPRDTLE